MNGNYLSFVFTTSIVVVVLFSISFSDANAHSDDPGGRYTNDWLIVSISYATPPPDIDYFRVDLTRVGHLQHDHFEDITEKKPLIGSWAKVSVDLDTMLSSVISPTHVGGSGFKECTPKAMWTNVEGKVLGHLPNNPDLILLGSFTVPDFADDPILCTPEGADYKCIASHKHNTDEDNRCPYGSTGQQTGGNVTRFDLAQIAEQETDFLEFCGDSCQLNFEERLKFTKKEVDRAFTGSYGNLIFGQNMEIALEKINELSQDISGIEDQTFAMLKTEQIISYGSSLIEHATMKEIDVTEYENKLAASKELMGIGNFMEAINEINQIIEAVLPTIYPLRQDDWDYNVYGFTALTQNMQRPLNEFNITATWSDFEYSTITDSNGDAVLVGPSEPFEISLHKNGITWFEGTGNPNTSGISVNDLEVNPPSIIPPNKQLAENVHPSEISCKEDFKLIQKMSDGSPKCVSSNTYDKLIKRDGWEPMPVMGMK